MKEKKEIQTVSEHCTHPDCFYRRPICYGTECCLYAALEQEVRGCKISECTRYIKGEKLRPRISIDTVITWEYELYDGTIDEPGYHF